LITKHPEENIMSQVHTATSATFATSVLQSDMPTLVDFTATWCGPCKALAPIIDSYATKNQGKVNVFKVDIDDSGDIATNYGITGVPTLILFKGGKAVGKTVGLLNEERLNQFVQSHLG
jgi:thioredoxin 1